MPDLLDVLILVLRIVVVALLYGFLVMVLRTAGRGLALDAQSVVRSPVQRLALRVLEPGASDLRAGQVFDVVDGATLGRAAHADVVLADGAVSASHARLSRVGRAWVVTDLDSTNGTRVNARPVRGDTPLSVGDVLALGTVTLEVVRHAQPD